MQDFLSLIFDDLHLKGVEYFFMQARQRWAYALDLGEHTVLHAVLTGTADVEIGDETLTLGAGDLLIIPRGLPHRIREVGAPHDVPVHDMGHALKAGTDMPFAVGEGEFGSFLLSACCRIDVELGQPLISALPDAIPIRGLQASPPEWLRIGIEFLIQERRALRPGHQSILNRLADIWFVECLRSYVENLPEGNESWLRALKDPALATVLSAIHREPGHGWTVPALAELACLSRSAFADRFQRIMGKPPLTYVGEHRMRLAAWQLKHSDQPVCRIAEAVGYSSETAFGQTFKRSFGMPPGRYREQQRQAGSRKD